MIDIIPVGQIPSDHVNIQNVNVHIMDKNPVFCQGVHTFESAPSVTGEKQSAVLYVSMQKLRFERESRNPFPLLYGALVIFNRDASILLDYLQFGRAYFSSVASRTGEQFLSFYSVRNSREFAALRVGDISYPAATFEITTWKEFKYPQTASTTTAVP